MIEPKTLAPEQEATAPRATDVLGLHGEEVLARVVGLAIRMWCLPALLAGWAVVSMLILVCRAGEWLVRGRSHAVEGACTVLDAAQHLMNSGTRPARRAG